MLLMIETAEEFVRQAPAAPGTAALLYKLDGLHLLFDLYLTAPTGWRRHLARGNVLSALTRCDRALAAWAEEQD